MVNVLATTVSILSQKGSNFLSLRRSTSCLSRYPVLPLNSNRAMFSCMGKSENRHKQSHSCPLSSAQGGAVSVRDEAQQRHKEVQHWPAVVKNRSSGLTQHDVSQNVIKEKKWLVTSSHVVYGIMWLSVHCVFISTHRLVVERHHLAAYVPKRLGVVIGWVHSRSFGVNPAHLPLIVSKKGGLGSTALYLCVCMWTRILSWQHKEGLINFNQPI